MFSEKNSIIIRNEYYPHGLTENQVMRVHILNKDRILKEVGNNHVVLCIAIDINKYVILRKIRGKYITLSYENFEEVIHPRVISIFKELGNNTNIWCLDIDAGRYVSEDAKKQVLEELLDFVSTKLYKEGFVRRMDCYRITSTSTGYHLFIETAQVRPALMNYNLAKVVFSDFLRKYGSIKHREDQVTIDLSVMRPRGSHVVVGSLNRNGLLCMDITKNWKTFDRREAVVLF